MPKKQPTAAKRARTAARDGAKYTEALRAASPDPAAPDWDDLVVSALSAVVAEHGVVPVTVLWDEGARHSMVQRVRWGVAEASADGVVIHEVRGDVGAAPKGTRVPVPYRRDGGQVEVAALWPVVWCSNREPFWRYVHNGWSVERPGDFPHALDPMCPSPDLPYEVRVYNVPDGIVGEDHTGTTPQWWTRAWCDRLDKAVLLADTAVAHRLDSVSRPAGGDCGDLRAEVWQHSTADLGTLPLRVHRADADPDRPVVPRLPFDTWPKGRPASTEPTPEPTWFQGEKHPPTYDLRVWSEADGWMTLGWIVGGRNSASITAALLRVGTGGPFPFAETWGPHHPDAWNHDWTQEGRELKDRHPDEPYAESTARYDEKRRQETADLAAALAARSGGALTVEQAAARIEAGGQEYRDFLRVGQICIMDALNEKRLAAEGDERLRLRKALDVLENHHQVDDWVRELTAAHMATNPRDGHFTAGARRWRRRALQEYLTPGTDTAALRVQELAPAAPDGKGSDGGEEAMQITVTSITIGPPKDTDFGGHEFEHESSTDLFRCTECRVYEVVARDGDGPIAPCTGLVGYDGDTERVYLLLTENPLAPNHAAFLATKVRSTGIGRAPKFSWRGGRLLVESAPSVVAELARQIELITTTIDGQQVPAVASVEHLTAEEGRAVLAENYAAYVAEYGERA